MIGHLECGAVNKQNLFVICKLFCLRNVKFLPADNSMIKDGLSPLRQLEYEVL